MLTHTPLGPLALGSEWGKRHNVSHCFLPAVNGFSSVHFYDSVTTENKRQELLRNSLHVRFYLNKSGRPPGGEFHILVHDADSAHRAVSSQNGASEDYLWPQREHLGQ